MYYLAFLCCLLLWRLRTRRGGSGQLAPTFHNWGLRGVIAATVASVSLFAARLALVYLADIDPRAPQWLRQLPIVAIRDQHSYWYDPYRQLLAAGIGVAAFGSSVALYVLYGSLQAPSRRAPGYAIVIVAGLLMALEALAAPGLGSTDPYLYAVYGEVGLHSYGSQPLHVPCAASPAAVWCSGPKLPALYGPLYLVYVHALLHAGGPVVRRIELLRLSNLGWFAVLLVLLRALRIPGPIIALAALNPLILAQYVGDAHNDIIPIDATLLGIAAARRYPAFGFVCGLAAGLLKLPFALLVSVVFLRLPLKQRLMWSIATVMSAIVLTLAWGGLPYLQSVAYYREYYPFFASVAQRCVVFAALGFLLFALLRRRISLLGAYAIPALGAGSTYPWYALWSLPYMQWEPAQCALYFIALPATGFLMETPFQMPLLWAVLILALALAAIRELVRPAPAASGSIVR
jgi:hypothetical protein